MPDPIPPDHRCRTCAHWENPWTADYPGGDIYNTAVVPEADVPRWGTCTEIGLASSFEYSHNYPLTAFTRDASDYVADLHTRDDFGCTLWTDHEPEEAV